MRIATVQGGEPNLPTGALKSAPPVGEVDSERMIRMLELLIGLLVIAFFSAVCVGCMAYSERQEIDRLERAGYYVVRGRFWKRMD